MVIISIIIGVVLALVYAFFSWISKENEGLLKILLTCGGVLVITLISLKMDFYDDYITNKLKRFDILYPGMLSGGIVIFIYEKFKRRYYLKKTSEKSDIDKS